MILSAQIPSKSYMISCEKHILDHEQLHFDIREYYRMKIKDSLNSIWYKNYDIKNKVLNSIFDNESKLQDMYDSSILNSQNRKSEQEKWNFRIRRELNIAE